MLCYYTCGKYKRLPTHAREEPQPKLLFSNLNYLADATGERRATKVEKQHYAFILVSNEKHWNKLCERNRTGKETHAFVRKNLVAPVQAEKLLFYIKKPAMQIRGVADFIERQTGNHEELWTKYGAESCFENFDEYHAFAEGRHKMTFIRFKNLVELENPKPPEITTSILGSLRWFRGRYVDLETAKQLTT